MRLVNRTDHCGLLLANGEVRYIRNSGDDQMEREPGGWLPESLFQSLQVSTLQRMGHRRWYLASLEMWSQEVVDLFHWRFYTPDDPVKAVGHQIADLHYRVDSVDGNGWRWHITFAPVPRAQAEQLLEYDYEAHWSANEARSAARQLRERLSEVSLFVDLDCYRDTAEMPVADWEAFVVRSQAKSDQLARTLVASVSSEEAR